MKLVRHMSVSLAAAALAALEVSRTAAIIEDLPPSHAVPLLRRLGSARAESVLDRVEKKAAGALRRVLSYHEGSAGALADPQVLTLPSDISVADAQKHLRRLADDVAYNVYVTDRDHRLVGVVTVRELLLARPKLTLESIMKRQPLRLLADSDLATIVANPAWQQLEALPVVDRTGVFLGMIRHRTIRQLAQTRDSSPGPVDIVNLALSIADMYWKVLSSLTVNLSIAGTSPRETDPQASRR
jgi:magnesium transporter